MNLARNLSLKMTPISPLQLQQHFFTLSSIRANPKGSSKAEMSLEPAISFQKRGEQSNEWTLGLRVVIRSAKPEAPFLYEIDIEIQGLVEVHNNFPAEKREQLAVINGLGMLYSAAREMILNVTARSVHGPMSLPTLNFVEIVSNLKGQQLQKGIKAEGPPTDQKPTTPG
jgi:preprotein translocase subunit SecB